MYLEIFLSCIMYLDRQSVVGSGMAVGPYTLPQIQREKKFSVPRWTPIVIISSTWADVHTWQLYPPGFSR